MNTHAALCDHRRIYAISADPKTGWVDWCADCGSARRVLLGTPDLEMRPWIAPGTLDLQQFDLPWRNIRCDKLTGPY